MKKVKILERFSDSVRGSFFFGQITEIEDEFAEELISIGRAELYDVMLQSLFDEDGDGAVDRVQSHIFTQETPSTVWNIEHGLKKFPNVRVYVLNEESQNYEMIHCKVSIIDNSNLALDFCEEVAGIAYLD